MNSSEFVKELSKELDIKKPEAKRIKAAMEKIILSELANGGKVTLYGFGTFDVVERNERKGRNPKTNEPLTIPKHNAPVFRFSDAVKKSFR